MRPTDCILEFADWHLSQLDAAARQALGYALDQGTRFVAVTNGDRYVFYDRLQGLSLETAFVGEFVLTDLTQDDLPLIDLLRPDALRNPPVIDTIKKYLENFGG